MKKKQTYLGLLIPLGLFAIHSLFYKDWLVDDAAISIAYAQNLAEGHGLVSQPGRVPVEAYSNPLWVFLLALCKKMGLWHVYATPKILAMASVGVSMDMFYKLFQDEYGWGRRAAIYTLSLLAINAPFVCWVNAGLENGFFVLLLTLFLFSLIKNRNPLILGLLLGALGLVRPEALLFGALGLIFLWKNGEQRRVSRLGLMALGFIWTFGSYLIFRRFYFGEWVPNPYFIKMGLGAGATNYLLKIHHLFRSLFGPFGGIGALVAGGVSAWILVKSAWKEKLLFPFAAWLVSVVAFLALPYDHLGWYRYATGFIWLSYLWGGIAFHRLLENIHLKKWGLGLALAIFLLANAGMGLWISQKRIANPPVPYSWIAAKYGQGFNEVAAELGIKEGAILVPDIGGTLLHSNFEAYDFPGLVDPVIARSYQKDSARFCDYIFEEIRPVLIGSHDLWLEDVDWQRDKRLERDYEVYRRGEKDVIWVRKDGWD